MERRASKNGTVVVRQTFNVAVFATPVAVNLVQNPGFEDDQDSNSRPDFWGTNGNYSRSSESVNSGTYSVKGSGTGSIGGINQTITLTANTDYDLSMSLYYASGTGTVVFDTVDKFDNQGP